MATTTNFIAELVAVEAYLQSQGMLGQPIDELRRNQVPNLATKIRAITDLTLESATRVSAALKRGAWDKKALDRFATVIQARLQNRTMKLTRDNQSCPTLERYLTEVDWLHIEDINTPATAALITMRNAARRCGILNPDEPTIGRIAEIVKYCNLKHRAEAMSVEDWMRFLKDTKRVLEPNKGKAWNHDWIVEYPADPRQLQPDVYATVFTATSGPPAMREVAQLGAIPPVLRRSHSSVKETTKVNPMPPDATSQMCTAFTSLFGPAMSQLLKQRIETRDEPIIHMYAQPAKQPTGLSLCLPKEDKSSGADASGKGAVGQHTGAPTGEPSTGAGKGKTELDDEPDVAPIDDASTGAGKGKTELDDELSDDEEKIRKTLEARAKKTKAVPKAHGKAKPSIALKPVVKKAKAKAKSKAKTFAKPVAKPGSGSKAKAPAAPGPVAKKAKAKAKAKASAAPKPVAKPKAKAKAKAAVVAPKPGFPSAYKGAKIYASTALSCFRVIFEPSVARSDSRFYWKHGKANALNDVIKAVNKYYA